MENNIPTAEEFIEQTYSSIPYELDQITELMQEFAKLHVEKVRDLQQAKYYAGETGYIKKDEWEELLTNIK